MNNIIKELTSEKALKRFLKEADYRFLEQLNQRIYATLADKKAEHEANEREEAARELKRKELLSLITSEGFSLADLVGDESNNKSARRKPKYEYTEDGVKKQWSGVGRTPRPIQLALNNGTALDTFLIKGQVENGQ